MSDKKKKNSGLFVACWFLIVLLLLILFFVKKDDISANLEKTDFLGKVFNKPSSTTEKIEKQNKTDNQKQDEFAFDLTAKNADKSKKSETDNVYEEATGTEKVKAVQENATVLQKTEETKPTEKAQKQPEKTSKDAETTKKVETAKKDNTLQTKVIPKTVQLTLYFVVINSDGTVTRKLVKREQAKNDSPLTSAINALLLGPSPQDKNCMTLIPEGTRLLGASVKDGVATLNFSEAFEFNSIGVEGYIAQLMQIVYTATEFSTVDSVQFLIEGEKKDYLGSEGQWIGTPLKRTSF